jgi:ABC-type uncharacterized transport system substrate-binding protein
MTSGKCPALISSEAAFSAVAREHADALIVSENVVNLTQRRRIIDFAAKNRLPVMYERKECVDDGGLIAYGPSVPEMFRRAAVYVDRMLKGAKPTDMPATIKKTAEMHEALNEGNGEPWWDRTTDPLIKSQVLCQLS